MSKGEISLRPFSSDDYDQVIKRWRLSGLTIKASDSLVEIEKLQALNPNRFLVAESNMGMVGTVIGAFEGRRAWIYHLAVLPHVRRRGVGQLLIREIERLLYTDGAMKVNLLVEPENKVAAHFYRSMGYSEVPFVFFTREL